jgi:hypothetical protein
MPETNERKRKRVSRTVGRKETMNHSPNTQRAKRDGRANKAEKDGRREGAFSRSFLGLGGRRRGRASHALSPTGSGAPLPVNPAVSREAWVRGASRKGQERLGGRGLITTTAQRLWKLRDAILRRRSTWTGTGNGLVSQFSQYGSIHYCCG